MAPSESKVGPQATTLDALDPFDSDRGPHLMQLMHLKSGPHAKTSEPFDSCGAFEPFDAEATEAGVGVCIQCPCATLNSLDSDPGPNLMNLKES